LTVDEGVSNNDSYWKTSKTLTLNTQAGGLGNLTLSSGEVFVISNSGITDASPLDSGHGAPSVNVWSGSKLILKKIGSLQATKLDAAITVGNTDSNNHTRSYLIFDGSLDTSNKVNMFTRESITLQYSGNLYFYGGGGTTNATGGAITIISSDSTCVVANLGAANFDALATLTMDGGQLLLAPISGTTTNTTFDGDATHTTPINLVSGSFLNMGNNTELTGNIYDGGATITAGGFDWTNPYDSTVYKDNGSAFCTINGNLDKTAGGTIDLSTIQPPPRPGVNPLPVNTLTITGDFHFGSATTSGILAFLFNAAVANRTSQLLVNGDAWVQNWDGTHGIQLQLVEWDGGNHQPSGTTWTFFTVAQGKTLTGGFTGPYLSNSQNTYTIHAPSNNSQWITIQ
jgi:hypothetical protein